VTAAIKQIGKATKRKPRTDAVRNRERVLEAANAVFSSGGPDASLEAVAHGLDDDLRAGRPVLVLIDSKRADVFAQHFAASLAPLFRRLPFLASTGARNLPV